MRTYEGVGKYSVRDFSGQDFILGKGANCVGLWKAILTIQVLENTQYLSSDSYFVESLRHLISCEIEYFLS